MRRLMVPVALSLILGGCGAYTLVEPTRTLVGDRYAVDPQIAWTAVKGRGGETWTVDGFALESLRFVRPLGDGESLFDLKTAQKAVFRRGMTPTEVLEFVVDSYTAAGARQVEARHLRPAPFGGRDGFRFDMDYTLGSGLEASALVAGAIVKDRLHLVIYQGARAHHFGRYRPAAERAIESLTLR